MMRNVNTHIATAAEYLIELLKQIKIDKGSRSGEIMSDCMHVYSFVSQEIFLYLILVFNKFLYV